MSGSRKSYVLPHRLMEIDPDIRERLYETWDPAAQVSELTRLRADNDRMRDALVVISQAEVGGGSLRTAAHDVAVLGADADLLRSRFS